jgi:TrmH family RNA methyltransferase
MITKNELKYYASLNQKKHRRIEKKFLVEGEKIVSEGLDSNFPCEIIFFTNNFLADDDGLVSFIRQRHIRTEVIGNKEFEKISETKSPQGIAGVFDIKEFQFDIKNFAKDKLVVYLDNISDPGNLGTILRTCDWFGIRNILISKNSADHLNSKVIRSSMGSVFHLNIYNDGESFLPLFRESAYKIICSDLNGKNIFDHKLTGKSILILSNESTGPSEEILKTADIKITIPGKGKAESLNVASAAAILLAHLTR